jgi:hypothetical protein
MRPARIGAAFEVIEPEVVLELTVLLLDGPATARERHEGRRGPSSAADAAASTSARQCRTDRRAASGRRDRSAAARATHRSVRSVGRRCPVPHVTVSHASAGAEAARSCAGTGTGVTPGTVKTASAGPSSDECRRPDAGCCRLQNVSTTRGESG